MLTSKSMSMLAENERTCRPTYLETARFDEIGLWRCLLCTPKTDLVKQFGKCSILNWKVHARADLCLHVQHINYS